ncbi:hypothetical protein FRX31_026569 [Thalictrum thalictroides]|uniref:Uncharacterized protein n=1 Tax=Thalictrum thalictroides TaxID=46969 RepID=A0A7J6VG17_THATH|nr:hypothetical protein FRX31_026569 [Thalictrum thalictroides]
MRDDRYLSSKSDPILDKYDADDLIEDEQRDPFEDDPHYQSLKTRKEKAAYAREIYEKNTMVPEDPDPVYLFGTMSACIDCDKPLPDELGVITLWERNQKRKLNGTEYLPKVTWTLREQSSQNVRFFRRSRQQLLQEQKEDQEANPSFKKLKLDQQEKEVEEEEEEGSLPTTTTTTMGAETNFTKTSTSC